MNMQELQKRGAFISPDLKKITVEWVHEFDGEKVTDTFDIYIKKLSFGAFDRIYDPRNQDKSTTALLISESVFLGDNGEEPISYADAERLDPSLAIAISDAINKEYSQKKLATKKKKKSGTS